MSETQASQPPKKKNKGGRPSLYKAEYCQMLIEHGLDGNPYETFGASVGVCTDTLNEWCDVHPEFSAAKKIGRTAALKWWFEMGKNNLITPEGEKFNATIWIFTLKAMFGLRDGAESKASEENPVGKTKEQLEAFRKETESLRQSLDVRKLRLVRSA